MISCVLSGGLGNQLFQLFTILAHHIQYDISYVFSQTKLTTNDKRPLYWSSFLSAIPPSHIVDPFVFINWNTYTDPKHTYTPLPQFDTSANTLLTGAFQSPYYFNDFKTEIMGRLNIHALKTQIYNQYLSIYNPEHKYTTISMHFRMGDYKHLRCYHPVLTWQYYVKALAHIVGRLDTSAHIIVYYFFERGDIVYVNDFLSHIQSAHPQCIYIPVTHVPTDWEEMLAMSCCDHHIIANSTFSWWGAYLHDNDNHGSEQIVCYPNVWYGHQLYYIDTRDLCLPTWTKIEVGTLPPCCRYHGQTIY